MHRKLPQGTIFDEGLKRYLVIEKISSDQVRRRLTRLSSDEYHVRTFADKNNNWIRR